MKIKIKTQMDPQNLNKANDYRMQIDHLKSIVRACEATASDRNVRILHISNSISNGYMIDLSDEIETFAKLCKLKAKEKITEIESLVSAL